mgnify:CR=1 FL=1
MTNKEFADSLRMVADFYEQHEKFPQPPADFLDVFSVNDKETLEQATRALGTIEKFTIGESLFGIKRAFGLLALRVIVSRTVACTRRVVGTEPVPERITPAYTREIVEWDCLPLLTGQGA